MKFANILIQELISLGAQEWEATELASHITPDIWLNKEEIQKIASEVWESEIATREALGI